jgi:hypothetical protein
LFFAHTLPTPADRVPDWMTSDTHDRVRGVWCISAETQEDAAIADSPQRRRKRWHRPRNVIVSTGVIVALVFFWGLWETAKVYHGEARIAVDYHGRFRRLAEEAAGLEAGSGHERWRQLAYLLEGTAELRANFEEGFRAAGFEPRDQWDDGSLDFDRVRLGPEVPSDCQREIAFIRRVGDAGLLATLRELADQPPGMPRASGEDLLGSEPFRRLDRNESARFLAKICAARMRLALTRGEEEEVVRAFAETLTLAQMLSYQPSIISHLIAEAIQWLAFDETRIELMETQFDETTCRALLEQVDRRPLAPCELLVEAVRMRFYDTVQRTYTDDGHGDGYWMPWEAFNVEKSGNPWWSMPNARPSWLEAAKARFLEESRASLVARFDEGFQRCLAQRGSNLLQMEMNPGAMFSGDALPEWAEDPVVSELAMISWLFRLDRKDKTCSDAARIMLALEIYHGQRGEYPASLDELVPAVLNEIPVDSRYMTPFGYAPATTDEGKAAYILYSFGADRTDNGGRVHEQDPTIALRDAGAGYDYRYPQPRFALEP